MKLREWHFYDLATGEFTGKSVCAKDERIVELALKRAPGCGVKEGACDPLQQRVDLITGKVIQCDVVKAASGHRWERENAMSAIRALEVRQARPMRELQIDPENADARARLAEIDEQIATLRAMLYKT